MRRVSRAETTLDEDAILAVLLDEVVNVVWLEPLREQVELFLRGFVERYFTGAESSLERRDLHLGRAGHTLWSRRER